MSPGQESRKGESRKGTAEKQKGTSPVLLGIEDVPVSRSRFAPDVPRIRDHLVRHGSAPPAAAAQAGAVLGYWVNLHAQVIGYRRALRFCAYLSAAGLIVSCFIHRRKEINVFDTA